MGQEAEVFARHGIGPLEDWTPLEAPARRRRWYDDGDGTMAVLLASASDLDDLIPTLVAYQIEWNKLRAAAARADWPPGERPDAGRVRGGARRRRGRLGRSSPRRGARRSCARLRDVAERRLNLRVRMLGGSAVGYARMTRRWWAPVRGDAGRAGARGPADVLRLLQPALDRQPAHRAPRARREDEITAWVELRRPGRPARRARPRSATGAAEGSWENFLYFSARDYFEAQPEDSDDASSSARREERAVGVTHISSAPRCASRRR